MDGEHDHDKFFLGDVRWQVSELGVPIILHWMYNKKKHYSRDEITLHETCHLICMKLLTPYEIHYS